MSDVAKRFGENLTRYRAKTSFSQEELATRAEVHRTQVWALLHGKQIPRLDTLVKLAGALEIPPAYLLEGITWKPAFRTGEFKVSASDQETREK